MVDTNLTAEEVWEELCRGPSLVPAPLPAPLILAVAGEEFEKGLNALTDLAIAPPLPTPLPSVLAFQRWPEAEKAWPLFLKAKLPKGPSQGSAARYRISDPGQDIEEVINFLANLAANPPAPSELPEALVLTEKYHAEWDWDRVGEPADIRPAHPLRPPLRFYATWGKLDDLLGALAEPVQITPRPFVRPLVMELSITRYQSERVWDKLIGPFIPRPARKTRKKRRLATNQIPPSGTGIPSPDDYWLPPDLPPVPSPLPPNTAKGQRDRPVLKATLSSSRKAEAWFLSGCTDEDWPTRRGKKRRTKRGKGGNPRSAFPLGKKDVPAPYATMQVAGYRIQTIPLQDVEERVNRRGQTYLAPVITWVPYFGQITWPQAYDRAGGDVAKAYGLMRAQTHRQTEFIRPADLSRWEAKQEWKERGANLQSTKGCVKPRWISESEHKRRMATALGQRLAKARHEKSDLELKLDDTKKKKKRRR